MGSPTPFTEHHDRPSEKFLDEQRVVVLYETNIHVLVVPIKGLHPEKGKDSVSTDLWNNNILNIILSKCTMYTQ